MTKKILTVEERWEQGIDHSERSVSLFNEIRRIDEKYGKDMFGFKAGGDGDNGEHLMYLLDIYFAATKHEELSSLLRECYYAIEDDNNQLASKIDECRTHYFGHRSLE